MPADVRFTEHAYQVECTDTKGRTIWLADFLAEELENTSWVRAVDCQA